ncbi:ABC transporter ATP-binding protein [Bordetella genomosp. 11]|uniref:ABC transporter n=1 Tax=Bordetella genomosp. 11 TaxID=1416808 RepID=A0A261UIW8_9BORD|nr:ABC transporter ATP-binding protein [Bordetella genomosp. 11]OZI61856.1 ABC transporter [Bordetella genomosp. 11]
MTQGIVSVTDLRVVARTPAGDTPIVKDVSFDIAKGEVLALIGESGSGKTTIALALLGYTRTGCRIAGGSIVFGGTDIPSAPGNTLRRLRGNKVAYVAQSAAASFNPSLNIMDQVTESVRVHGLMGPDAARRKAVDLFRSLALPSPETIGNRYPHQVSGGQLQRLMAAMALMSDPELVIFDEPTTALDVTTQIEVLLAFKKAIKDHNISAVYVSHDLAVVAQVADRAIVLRNGEIQEMGDLAQIVNTPAHAYTRSLMAVAAPVARLDDTDASNAAEQPVLLEVKGLTAGYGRKDREGLPAVPILHDVNMTVRRGSTMGVIGESGSGKSTLAYVMAGLLAPARGSVHFDGLPLAGNVTERSAELHRRIQLVFQNADKVLNPAHDVATILSRPLLLFKRCAKKDIPRRVSELLDMVKLPASMAGSRPGELSGGQKQRINLARALAAEPDIIICDEVTSALDTVVATAILDLLVELRRALGMTYLFISHDISTVGTVCDDITVLFKGRKVDSCERAALNGPERHPYTSLLLDSVPELRPGWLEASCERINERRLAL